MESKNVKGRTIRVRVTEDEYQNLKEISSKKESSISEYIRSSVFAASDALDKKLIIESLFKIGTLAGNISKSYDRNEEIKKEIGEEVRKAWQALL